MNQENFIKETQFELLAKLTADTQPLWGIMSAQHMVEHLSSLFLFTIEKITGVTFYGEEKQQRNYDYLIRDKKPFRRNIKLKSIEKPMPLRFESIDLAIAKLKEMVAKFYAYFEEDKSKKTMHPACGPLNFEEWEQMHFGHARHHLIQFGLLADEA